MWLSSRRHFVGPAVSETARGSAAGCTKHRETRHMVPGQEGRKAKMMASQGPAWKKQVLASVADALLGERNGGAPVSLRPRPGQPRTWPCGPDIVVPGAPQEGSPDW